MKDVILITNYWHFKEEKESSRYLSLSEMIAEDAIKLEVITSNFYHQTKTHRTIEEKYFHKLSYKIKLINEPGYRKNISLNRIYSHKQLATNVIKYLKNRKKPDVIYCVVPSLDLAYEVSKFAKKNKIKLIIDIQDLWPEAFNMAIKIPLLTNILTLPMKLKAKKIYSLADQIVAVSKTYEKKALVHNNKKDRKSAVAYLGVNLKRVDEILKDVKKIEDNKEIKLAYAGSLGHSYDLINVFKALNYLKLKRKDLNIKFIVMGTGPLEEKFKKYVSKNNINVEFTGRISYEEVMRNLWQADVAINSIVKKSVASIINKHADYSAASLPVINTQVSEEYRDLINEYEIGINCNVDDYIDLANAIEILSEDDDLRAKMSVNSRKLAEEKFDRNKTYVKIIELINE